MGKPTKPSGKKVNSPIDPLSSFHPAVRTWFEAVFPTPTRPQALGWSAIAHGDSTLILAPTGSGKTLAAFLSCIDRLMFAPVPPKDKRCRVLYISPIKALAVDIERNLQSPLVGISQTARKLGIDFHLPTVTIRSGDTPAGERAHFARHPSDILITTPESLYLLLTSNAREALRSIETVVVDEIHAITPTKRGSHLALSLERLEHLCGRPLQRIGLSATQRPLEEVARFLGGAVSVSSKKAAEKDASEQVFSEFEGPATGVKYRSVAIIDASEPKQLDLRIEVPVEDMARLDEIDPLPSGPASQGPVRPSIWSAIHPKLLELVRTHQSTLIFVNNRRLSERIAGAVNELAGETLVRAHHGSVALSQRKEIEDRLKMGTLKGLVATSSLELGIDMGAIDLVVQIESPPSIASGMQRVGRASHHVGGTSEAVIYPKYRADLVACAAITRAMYDGKVESVHYPRNPLDVLAQQIVAMVAMDSWDVNDLLSVIRKAAPYAALTRPIFESVLDMLSGRYPSDEFVELRPRVTWDRVARKLTAREGSRRVAVVNGGTIPDRGLFGVFLSGATKGARVGELDEEMVFESRAGDTIILGASTWRVEDISHDRVIVSPAPGEPGKMPFWHGDTAGRPSEFGERIGQMTRELVRLPRPVAFTKLVEDHSLDASAAENLLRYLDDQAAATGKIPSDQDILIERCRDELGDWRICLLTPFGSRVHAPWCMAVSARLRAEYGMEAESMWSDDGFVLRLPDSEQPLEAEMLVPTSGELKELVLRQLGSTSLFAAKFREAAGRALLLPKRRPGVRAPLWQQRKRAADLLAVASRFSSFPILLETYRECIRDVFDLPATTNILKRIQQGDIRVTTIDSEKPSPYAAALLFSYIANYIYEGDAPLAERRAQALSIDQSQLEELLGSTDFRELLDPTALDELEATLQALDPDYQARHADGLHDLLLKLGDLSESEIAARTVDATVASSVQQLVNLRRAVQIRVSGETRFIPVEYAGRYRDALGVPLPPGIAEVFLEHVAEPLTELVRRYARTHGPFTTGDLARRFDLPESAIEPILTAMHGHGRLLEGEFRPSGKHREWFDPELLRQVRRKTLARLRREIEPVEQRTFARFLTRWHGITVKRRGIDALLDTIETVQGAPLLASELEREILPSRIIDYRPTDLDALMAAGEVVWVGVERNGEHDGRIALYLTESLPLWLQPTSQSGQLSERAQRIVEVLERQGASFFTALHEAAGDGFPGDTVDGLWELVWAGIVTNDTFHPLRSLISSADSKRVRGTSADGPPGSVQFLRRLRARASGVSPTQGRWSLVRQRASVGLNQTNWTANIAQQLLVRNGIVMRETAIAENISGGYPTIYPALKAMEEGGWIRRGLFVAGLGAAQFAMTAAVDMLRGLRTNPDKPETVHIAASDPANPYGTLLPWPTIELTSEQPDALHTLSRTSGASVILVNGQLTAFFRRRNPAILVFLPENEPELSGFSREVSRKLAEIAVRRQGRKQGLLISTINDQPARQHFLARFLEEAGFVNTALGYQMRRVSPGLVPSEPEADTGAESEDTEEQESTQSA
jgi:ATP-dependent Lhr-like helicase